MMPGETLFTGALATCPDCGVSPELKVLKANSWYIGTFCDCGPYSRETHYFATKEDAEAALADPIKLAACRR
jgi:hypothetical protein